MTDNRSADSPRRWRAWLTVVALSASLALAACGGDDGADTAADTAPPDDAVEQAALDYGESEGAAACDFLSQSALEELGGQEECATQFEDVPSATFEVEDVQVSGDTADAKVRNTESNQVIDLKLVNEGGTWKVSQFPGLGS